MISFETVPSPPPQIFDPEIEGNEDKQREIRVTPRQIQSADALR